MTRRFIWMLVVVLPFGLVLGRTMGDWISGLHTGVAWAILPWLLLVIFWAGVVRRFRRNAS